MRKILLTIVTLAVGLSAAGQIDKDLKQEYVSAWSKLIPTHLKLQYAGDMGTLSAGPGWDYGSHRTWETNLFVGFLRSTSQSPTHLTVTLKQAYKPFHLSLGQRCSIEPITGGIYMTKLFGQYFWEKLPDRYPNGYYFWALNTRFNVFLGQSVTYRFSKYLDGDSFSLFYEFNTNDLYIISAVKNRYLGLRDIINLSFGAKFTFL
ncbi:hypothetical protein [uncultured Acetobacteroides sp.]|uniref:hypothetical protein n=1 Tax=uncultured Acetobacteroides sp. TaxID=1760811 RepID=UPI0029F478F5|nr:hypothetical protein [uncultured Acetobacteroides sp.]